ncbi:armadillo repeat containing 7-like protein [Pilobolus umbonatus]|nr:armadillo repeat containing 7-like protein [Pilobolus umbonatus]
MFQSKRYIERRHGATGTDRAYYLNQLVQEYKVSTTKLEAQQQILANLANFAYDPINYDILWDIRAVDLFLEAIQKEDPQLIEFGLGGLANICLESRHYHYLISNQTFINKIILCLNNTTCSKIIVNAMTTLMQLVTSESYGRILTPELKKCLIRIKGQSTNQHVITMTSLFLMDYFQS